MRALYIPLRFGFMLVLPASIVCLLCNIVLFTPTLFGYTVHPAATLYASVVTMILAPVGIVISLASPTFNVVEEHVTILSEPPKWRFTLLAEVVWYATALVAILLDFVLHKKYVVQKFLNQIYSKIWNKATREKYTLLCVANLTITLAFAAKVTDQAAMQALLVGSTCQLVVATILLTLYRFSKRSATLQPTPSTEEPQP